jgi:hypothetical protein
MTSLLSIDEFVLEEFKALRKEIDDRLKDIMQDFQFSLIAIAGIYAWLATRGNELSFIYSLGFWGPILIAGYGAFRCALIGLRIYQLRWYIRNHIEHHFGVEGWETYLPEMKLGAFHVPPGIVPRIYAVGWTALLVVTFVVKHQFGGGPPPAPLSAC